MNKEKKNQINRDYRARNKERIRAARASNLEGRYKDLKARAARTGRKFNISLATYKRMIKSGCYYCGVSLMNELGGSLDRINNNNRSYVTKNVVPCCKNCNYVKSKVLTHEETSFAMETLKQLKNGAGWAKGLMEAIRQSYKAKRKKWTGR